jgi:uncharacterized protein YjbI with pentapeptide repeats
VPTYMKLMRWMGQHKTALAVVLGLIVLIVAGIWFWGVLEGYVNPGEKGSTGRRDVVQAFALILAGVVGFIGGIVGIANLSISRRNLRQQRELDERRAQDEALQSYFEQIGDLITEHALMVSTEASDPIRLVANAQTLTVLGRLDPERRKDPLLFLYGAGLVNRDNKIVLLTGTDLTEADLIGADLNRANLSGANLSRANLSGANLSRAVLLNSDLSGANLSDANLSSTVLIKANLEDAIVSEEQLTTCESLAGATMHNGQKHEDWRATRQNFEDFNNRPFFVNNRPFFANLSRADLSGGDLRETDLSATYLSGANLSGADLSRANLSRANLSRANLSRANLTEAHLTGANFSEADVTQADLTQADLSGANLSGANLSFADLTDAEVTEEQLAFSVSLDTATMPTGQGYEDWRRTRPNF